MISKNISSSHLPSIRYTPLIIIQLSTFGEGKVNVALQKKIAEGSEAIIILEGVVGFLDQPISVLVRLQSALSLNDLPEVDIGTRFLFLFAGPPIRNASLDDESGPSQFADIGISLATAFTDKEFVTEVIINVLGLLICKVFLPMFLKYHFPFI